MDRWVRRETRTTSWGWSGDDRFGGGTVTWRFTRMGTGGWVGRIGHVRVYLSDEDGEANRAQAGNAEAVRQALPSLRDEAAAYLDAFVDRTRACGADEPWWLDEIEFRGHAEAERTCYSLHFTLHGDDGGLWTVDMQVIEDRHRPFRFERLQG